MLFGPSWGGGSVQEPTNQKAARWHWLRLTPHVRHSGVPWPRLHRALWLESLRYLGPGSGFGSRGFAEEVSESCARAEESEAREGMTWGGGGGAGMMQCLATGVRARRRRRRRWWWEVLGSGREGGWGREERRRSARSQYPTAPTAVLPELVCPPPITFNLLLHKRLSFSLAPPN